MTTTSNPARPASTDHRTAARQGAAGHQAVRSAGNMAWIAGGTFAMGSADFYSEERPVHQVTVDGFWLDEHPVTVAQYRRFAQATGYVTVAERPPDPADFPGADPALLVPGSLVFHRTPHPVDTRDFRNWWAWVPGASWQHPDGPARGGLDGAARQGETVDSATSHLGFRCVIGVAGSEGDLQ